MDIFGHIRERHNSFRVYRRWGALSAAIVLGVFAGIFAVGCDREVTAPQRSHSVPLPVASASGQSSGVVAQFHDHFTGSVPADSGVELCGIPTNLQFVVTDNFFVLADGNFRDTGNQMLTYTNPLNGKAVIISLAGQIGGQTIVDSLARTITFVTSYKGLPEKIQTAKGSVLSRDVGLISFADTFSLDTGGFISESIVSKGPHPEADSGFALFCQVVSPALS